MRNPFVDAERYIQLRKHFSPRSWGDTMVVINELLVSPFITLFLALEYNELKYAIQRMFLITMANGGPFIVTNDSDYMPYVWADGFMRVSQRH
jgi:hypothetical protein